MKYGIYTPNFGAQTDARLLSELARDAEEAGWDGFFIWDHILASRNQPHPVVDPWVTLAAIAMTTQHIRIGTSVTPVARRRPWKLARETVTLDHLSGGRLILSVGLGAPPDADFADFGDESDARIRAQLLDEGLAILAGLWSNKPFHHQGKHYQIRETTFHPPPVQQPRIPIWVGGMWPNRAPFRRAARWDGAFPILKGSQPVSSQDLQEVRAYIDAHRESDLPFDLVTRGYTPGNELEKSRAMMTRYAEAGLTWWLESLSPFRDDPAKMRERIWQGPPKI